MWIKAGVISLVLLLLSRVLGLARESALAASLGRSAQGDVAVLMLSLPDWISGVLAAGALGYVLLPHWARQQPDQRAASQRRVARALLAVGLAGAIWMVAFPRAWLAVLVPGLSREWLGPATTALWFCAVALPLALLASLWATRLQHEQDFTGMYAANLTVNVVVIAGLLSLGWASSWAHPTVWLGLCLVLAMLGRLAWLRVRLSQAASVRGSAPVSANVPWPLPSVWGWAMLASGLPMLLPFAARSMASASGPGALATFNYAWKLVELPLVLAIQLAASLSFPAIARAFAADEQSAGGRAAEAAVRQAWVVTWTLACVAAAGLLMAAPSLAQLLFGWGRMDAQGLLDVAAWGRIGAWSLLPQAALAVALTVLAAQSRMKVAVAAYATAAVLQWAVGHWAGSGGAAQMWLLNAVMLGAAVAVTTALGGRMHQAIAWRHLLLTAATLPLVLLLSSMLGEMALLPGLLCGALAALAVAALSWWVSPELRQALQR